RSGRAAAPPRAHAPPHPPPRGPARPPPAEPPLAARGVLHRGAHRDRDRADPVPALRGRTLTHAQLSFGARRHPVLPFALARRAMKPTYDYDLICIGSGPAGQRGAVQAAKRGKRVAVVEKQRTVGGVCIETGTIPSKTFREAVRGFRAARGDGDGGPRVRPTMEQLVRRVAQVILKEEDVVQDQLSRNGIDLVKGRAAFVDAHVLSVESTTGRRSLSAENILLAVGTRP